MRAFLCFKPSVCYLQYSILIYILALFSPTISDVGLVEWEKVSGKGINDQNLLILTVSSVVECKRLCLEYQPQCRSIDFHTGDLRCLLQDVAFGDAGIYNWYSSAYFEYYSLCELGKSHIPHEFLIEYRNNFEIRYIGMYPETLNQIVHILTVSFEACFHHLGLTFIPAWIGDYVAIKMWGVNLSIRY